MGAITVHDTELRDELERRLATVESPGYDDPARADLPGRDIAIVWAFVVVVCVLAYIWGY